MTGGKTLRFGSMIWSVAANENKTRRTVPRRNGLDWGQHNCTAPEEAAGVRCSGVISGGRPAFYTNTQAVTVTEDQDQKNLFGASDIGAHRNGHRDACHHEHGRLAQPCDAHLHRLELERPAGGHSHGKRRRRLQRTHRDGDPYGRRSGLRRHRRTRGHRDRARPRHARRRGDSAAAGSRRGRFGGRPIHSPAREAPDRDRHGLGRGARGSADRGQPREPHVYQDELGHRARGDGNRARRRRPRERELHREPHRPPGADTTGSRSTACR